MAIKPQLTGLTELTDEERLHGLGGAEDHAREKMRRVAERHADVLAELSAFVSDGHALTLIHGNHDIEFHWDGVKEDFRAILLRHAENRLVEAEPVDGLAQGVQVLNGRAFDKADFLARIEFRPWFFYRDGVAYIEHGHQYDPFCSTANVLSPLSPLDPRRIARGFSEVLLRYVVRPTRGMTEHGHETFGMLHYLSFGAKLGIMGMLDLGVRFVRAIVELFRVRRAHFSEAAAGMKKEHERRVTQLAEVTRDGKERLRALLSLQAQPLTHSVFGILASVLLDRLALAIAAAATLVVLAIVGGVHVTGLSACAAVILTWGLVHRYLSSRRKVDPTKELMERATHLSRIFPAAFVVMGHTHVPKEVPAGSATYINLGSWAEEELVEGADAMHAPSRAARTHVVIHVNDAGVKARFCTWHPTSGVSPFLPTADKA
jgi:hypothetical protein